MTVASRTSGRWPNLFVVGAGRAGTTSLWHYLRQHPAVFMSELKEPHYFTYRPTMQPVVTSEREYLRLLRRPGRPRIVGDESPSHLRDPAAAPAIHAACRTPGSSSSSVTQGVFCDRELFGHSSSSSSSCSPTSAKACAIFEFLEVDPDFAAKLRLDVMNPYSPRATASPRGSTPEARRDPRAAAPLGPRARPAVGPLKRLAHPVDIGVMTVRTLGLLSLVATLAIAGWLYSQQAKQAGPTSDLAEQAQADAAAGVAGANFQAAAPELQAWFAEHATYAGIILSPGYNVVVRHADATSYCLQAGSGATVQHVDGPGGAVAPGPC